MTGRNADPYAMVAVEIKDRETLEAWLKGRSREDAVCIAHRAAMRVAPLFWDRLGFKAQNRLANLFAKDVVFWALLVSGIARNDASPEVREAAKQARVVAYSSDFGAFGNGAPARAAAAAAALAAALEPNEAAAAASLNATASAARAAESPSFWEAVARDCMLLEANRDPLDLPLWVNLVPAQIAIAWQRTKWELDRAESATWALMLQWYENALAGRPQDWPLLHDIALIPEEDWRGGPDWVDPIIEAMLLDRAVKATDNGETIAINPQTGKAHIVPGSALPPDLAIYVKRKISRALAIFGTASANQYTALQPDLALLAEVVAEADTLPVELFDACASVSRRVIHRARMGECPDPEKDPLLADFLHRIREAGADVLGNDPKTQEVLARRVGIAGNSAFTEGREVILAAVRLLVSVSEGYLAKVMPRDAEVATNPESDPEDRKVSAFRFAGRLLRYPVAVAAVGGSAVIGVATFIQSYQFIMALPQVQAAIQVVLKYLGYI